MRNNLKKVIGVIVLLILVLAAALTFFQPDRAGNIQQALAETRRTLRDQGFKTDLADFNLSTDAALRSRETALTFFSGYAQPVSAVDTIDLLPAVADGSAVIIWKQDSLKGQEGLVAWPDLHDELDENGPQLDAACEAAMEGPIRFDLDAHGGRGMLLRHLAPLKRLGQTLGVRTVTELHDGHSDNAWTNLFALTRLSTAWNVEPAEVSHMIQFVLANFGFNAAWQSLLDNHWPDEKLATLQHEWESANYFTNLPEVAAFQCASDVDLCRQERQQPLTGGMPMSEVIKQSLHAPSVALSTLKQSWSAERYRNYGSFEDEKNLLLFYQQRELEMRHAITASTWLQMQALPGVTNVATFTSPYRSRLLTMMTMMSARTIATRPFSASSTFLERAVTAEARRRVIVAAIALERFRLKHDAYPQSLAELAPEFLKTTPLDFIDGQPLRYRLAGGHFTLYSVGLDGIDNGGTLPAPTSRPMRRGSFGLAGPGPNEDIVWPRPAEAVAVAAQQQQDMDAIRARTDETEDLQANVQWEYTARHQADVDAVLSAPAITNIPDITLEGRPLSEVLRNPQTAGTNKLSLVDMLTLKQIITGGQPETITFELPVAYDVITNLGETHLYLDTNNDDSDQGCNAVQMTCTRATNGDCLLAWSTIYESSGQHALQAGLTLTGLPPDKQDIEGPVVPFTITNLCQFSLASAQYDPSIGAGFHAKLPEANASYSIELNSTNGERLKTISGSTSNGELKVFWNLRDDHGKKFAGTEFNSVFHLTFPDSGRTQTLRGP